MSARTGEIEVGTPVFWPQCRTRLYLNTTGVETSASFLAIERLIECANTWCFSLLTCIYSVKAENIGNSAGNEGGAIYNAGKTSFTQDATFEDNNSDVSNGLDDIEYSSSRSIAAPSW